MKRKRNSDKISKTSSSGTSNNYYIIDDKVVNYQEEMTKLKELNHNQSIEIERLKSIEDDYT